MVIDLRGMLTADVRKTLGRFAKNDAFTPDALQEQGIPAPLIKVMLADGPCVSLERARISLSKRTRVETRVYVWGPDVPNLLKGWE